MFKLSEETTKRFAEATELGMGYQFVECTDGDDLDRFFVLLNARILVPAKELYTPHTHSALGELDEDVLLDKLPSIESQKEQRLELSEDVGAFREIARVFARMGGERPLHGSPPLSDTTAGPMAFVRYSTSSKDPRITSDGVTPGTYVTTLVDSHEVPSGLAAVGRYALPNPRPAVEHYDIEVPAGVFFRYGSVTPAFSRAGGGAEVEFPNGVTGGNVNHRTITRM